MIYIDSHYSFPLSHLLQCHKSPAFFEARHLAGLSGHRVDGSLQNGLEDALAPARSRFFFVLPDPFGSWWHGGSFCIILDGFGSCLAKKTLRSE